ncbi:uncharacterized protein SCHCODRAFT_01296984 [Schizophyllum commune H4-8]|uniref:uncharacterized protein n=1 Tax=Schizophyllum commune (strain H4-8 / FGSC 9210) TaxID=578458 RepID=UPI00215F66A7|nr:uncharacterized protein SCHCODRAFT_01296984 [Schizophyllum commune H4-8]KAI5897153.1 hypothetical protein SCHCODRAFT_01296984 [Schizophyllum commune H4-8]
MGSRCSIGCTLAVVYQSRLSLCSVSRAGHPESCVVAASHAQRIAKTISGKRQPRACVLLLGIMLTAGWVYNWYLHFVLFRPRSSTSGICTGMRWRRGR